MHVTSVASPSGTLYVVPLMTHSTNHPIGRIQRYLGAHNCRNRQ
jgi:hypothetical protein